MEHTGDDDVRCIVCFDVKDKYVQLKCECVVNVCDECWPKCEWKCPICRKVDPEHVPLPLLSPQLLSPRPNIMSIETYRHYIQLIGTFENDENQSSEFNINESIRVLYRIRHEIRLNYVHDTFNNRMNTMIASTRVIEILRRARRPQQQQTVKSNIMDIVGGPTTFLPIEGDNVNVISSIEDALLNSDHSFAIQTLEWIQQTQRDIIFTAHPNEFEYVRLHAYALAASQIIGERESVNSFFSHDMQQYDSLLEIRIESERYQQSLRRGHFHLSSSNIWKTRIRDTICFAFGFILNYGIMNALVETFPQHKIGVMTLAPIPLVMGSFSIVSWIIG